MPKTHFECVICGEDKFEALPRWVDDSRICDECAEECVVPQFHDALEHEHHYPPMFGSVEMDIWTFWDLFDSDFLTAWREKLQEYNVPVRLRLYCEHRSGDDGFVCGAYLGIKGTGFVCCSLCRCFTCRKCEARTSDAISANTHRCREASKEDPFEKLTKGKEYQQCPGCKKEIFQAEGCNHMVCIAPCSTHFCFYCGKKVIARRSGHWQRGLCPRFGVDGKRLIWDDEGQHSEEDIEEFDSDPDFETDDETGELAMDEADPADIDLLIERFDQAHEAEQHEDTRHRTMIAPMIHRESRADFFMYISFNLALLNQVRLFRFELLDAADVLEEFSNRHQHIIRQLRQYQSRNEQVAWSGSRVIDLADLEDELDSYILYAGETIEDLQHIVQQEIQRAAREN
jgi:hypothetical protein